MLYCHLLGNKRKASHFQPVDSLFRIKVEKKESFISSRNATLVVFSALTTLNAPAKEQLIKHHEEPQKRCITERK